MNKQSQIRFVRWLILELVGGAVLGFAVSYATWYLLLDPRQAAMLLGFK